MKKKLLYIFAIVFLTMAGCKKDYNLEKIIFNPDPDFPDLPAYTEWGYNTFGAYYDRLVFTTSENIVPLKIIVRDGLTSLRFNGTLNNYQEMSMTFTMDDFLPSVYEELIQLDQKILDLKDPHYSVIIKINDEVQPITILSGRLEFKKVQNLIVDKEPEEVIISGEFEFQIVIDDEPFTISRGRFDQGVSYDNFFRF